MNAPMTDLFQLGTATTGDPLLTIRRGRRQWDYVLTQEGPQIECEKPPPSGVAQAAGMVHQTLEWQSRALAPRTNAARMVEELLDRTLALAGNGLLFDHPAFRKQVVQTFQYLHKRALEHGTSADLAETCLAGAAKLQDLLRRYETRDIGEGPTEATVAKHQPDELDELLRTGRLGPYEQDAAKEARQIHRALTAKLDSRAGRYDPGSYQGSAAFTHPIEELPSALHEPYMYRYRPWSLRMSELSWTWSISEHMNGHALEKRRVKACGVSVWAVVVGILDGQRMADSDAQHHLPMGQSFLVLRKALREYPKG